MKIAPRVSFLLSCRKRDLRIGVGTLRVHNEHEGCSQDLGHSSYWEESSVWAQKGHEMESFHCGAVGSGVVPPAPLGEVLTQVAAPAARASVVQ